MKAYAILAGGGVKGVALAGCLAAAEDKGIEFIGFGGASAGSIVATLGALEYSGRDIRDMMKHKPFSEFLDDEGEKLERLKVFSQQLFIVEGVGWRSGWRLYKSYSKERHLFQKLYADSGLYNARRLEQFLRTKITEKPLMDRRAGKERADLPADFTFRDLRQAGYKSSLKVIASDLVSRRPIIFSTGELVRERDWSVVTAVRASTSYPFVFEPVSMNRNYYADGGISSNLPVFLFEHERKTDSYPILAFDLVPEGDDTNEQTDYGLFNFCSDLLGTSLESSDKLLQGLISGLHYIPVPVPRRIDTLKFKLTEDEQTILYSKGYEAATDYFNTKVRYWFDSGRHTKTKDVVKDIQRGVRVLPVIVNTLLERISKDFESGSSVSGVRANIMLTTDNSQLVVYQYGMDADPDIDFQIDLRAGWSGVAREKLRPVIADLTATSDKLGLSREQQNKIPRNRKSAMSIPLFDMSTSISGKVEVSENKLIGTLNIDTTTSLDQTGWTLVDQPNKEHPKLTHNIAERALFWGAVVSKLLS